MPVLNDWGKLIMLVLVLIAASVLAAIHVLDPGDVKVVLFTELGYITGNGVLARSKSAPSPVLVAPTAPTAPGEG